MSRTIYREKRCEASIAREGWDNASHMVAGAKLTAFIGIYQ